MNKNSKIFVTGATGLVGSYLLHELHSAGYNNLHALHRPSANKNVVKDLEHLVSWHVGDVTDMFSLEEAMQDAKVVFHAAAVVSYDSRDYHKLMKINVEGTENVINVATDLGVEHFIHVSSIGAIGRDKNEKQVTEKAKWERTPLLTNYSISKYQSEQIVWRAAAEGLAVTIVNPSIILGAGNWEQSSTTLFRQVYEGLKFYPVGTTGFVDVKDVARFMRLVMEQRIVGERFIVSATNLSYQSFFTKVATAMGKTPPSIRVTPLLRALAWRIEWLRSRLTGKRVVITKETATTSAQTYFFDNTKSLQIAGFQYTDIDNTIKNAVAALTQNLTKL
jgi:dihydroflavonol-4-reductase